VSTRVPSPLVVDALNVAIGRVPILRDVSFTVAPGEAYGLVGESGSGKTMTARAILGLLPPGAAVIGRIGFGELSLLELSRRRMQDLRGSRIAMIFQDPMSSLNPVLRVGEAIEQVLRSHERIDGRAARRRAVELMARVGIRDPQRRFLNYPHEFSGGMRQRILIAMALAARPQLLLADEPTTALDVIVQAGILRLLDRLRREESMSLLLVSHDFSVVAGMCDRVGVMYAGELVEEGPREEVLFRPRHPYTRALIESLPESTSTGPLPSIPGSPPDPGSLPPGCPFAPRCPLAAHDCTAAPIPLVAVGAGHVSRCIHVDRLDAMRLDLTVEEAELA
jgi:oligopeptide/dipeptide ABC transporter ATP-binding protein